MADLTLPPRPTIKRLYPHLGEVADPPASQTLRLLWDRIHDLEERLQQTETLNTKLIATANSNTAAAAQAQTTANRAVALAQNPGDAAMSATSDPATPLPGGGDGGAGATGCAAAGATGHDSGGPLNAVRAGQLICGTGNEFSALKNATATQAQRDANQEELLLRMIWHLKQGGFSAGRQQNPSGAISGDKLTVVVDAVLRAYDVFPGVAFSAPLTTQMLEVAPPVMVDVPGTPD
jgi:hypothetical protein